LLVKIIKCTLKLLPMTCWISIQIQLVKIKLLRINLQFSEFHFVLMTCDNNIRTQIIKYIEI